MNEAQKFVYTRTYSRWRDEFKRRENWEETVDRYFGFFENLYKDKVPAKVFKLTRASVLSMDVAPSMRALWSAGPALASNHILAYNCSYLPYETLQDPVDMFYILMCGAGVGFSVEKENICQMPVVQKWTSNGLGVHVVGDSREGWAESLRAGLNAWFNGNDIEFDYSHVRPRGAILKTMGGRASGPDPLKKLHEFTRNIIINAQGRQLKSIEWLDIGNMIGEVVVVGGVRRSSEISFSDLDDNDMRHAKDWPMPPHRYMSNNTAVYREKPDAVTFMKEWAALAASGTGERGIFNISGMLKHLPERRKKDINLRTNPCQPGYATVLTPNGISTIAQVNIGDTIWSGTKWTKIINKWSTGIKPVYKYGTSFGSFIGTENHKIIQNNQKIEVKDAHSIDWNVGPCPEPSNLDPQDIMDGLVIGDGTVHKASNNLVLLLVGKNNKSYFTDNLIKSLFVKERSGVTEEAWEIITTISNSELALTYNRTIPNRFWGGNLNKVRGFLRGLYSANGSVVADGGRITLKAASKTLIDQVQILLSALGIPAYITTNREHEVEFSNGKYLCKHSYDLNITTGKNQFMKLIGFIQPYKNSKVGNSGTPRVHSGIITNIEFLEDTEVFDLTVDAEEHTYWTAGLLVSNCGEILLRKRQFCNLSELVVRSNDTFDDLSEKVKSAAWLGAIQSTLTDFKFISPEFKKNCDEERLLGISITGQMDNPKLLTAEKLSILKGIALKETKKASKILGINFSVAITCGKPSGTLSQLYNCSSGMMARPAGKKYIRRYRISSTDPLYRMMKDQAVKFLPENGQGPKDLKDWTEDKVSTWVVAFPMKAPEKAITQDQLSAIDQLEWYLKIQQNWCEHNQSATIYVKDSEWLTVGDWVYNHFDDITGLSFLPADSGKYEQAPFESISEAEYDKMVKSFPKIDYSQLSKYEIEDQTEGAKTYACVGGSCEI